MPRIMITIERDSGDHETYGEVKVPNMSAAYALRDSMLKHGIEVATGKAAKPRRKKAVKRG